MSLRTCAAPDGMPQIWKPVGASSATLDRISAASSGDRCRTNEAISGQWKRLSWTLADSGSIASYIDQDVACGGMDLCRFTCPPRCLGIAIGPQLSPNVREYIAEGRYGLLIPALSRDESSMQLPGLHQSLNASGQRLPLFKEHGYCLARLIQR